MAKKSKSACKIGKAPLGKNKRCVTKKCKHGKLPLGKKYRCVSRTLKVATPKWVRLKYK
jgi:hypothetical protein